MRNSIVDKLRVSVTDRCNHRCIYCMPPGGVPLVAHEDVLRYEEIADIVRAMVEGFGLTTVRLTGGEPLLRGSLERLVRMLVDTGVPDVALTTNASRLAQRARVLADAGLARVNVSLDTVRPDTLARLSEGASLERTLAGIAEARQAGLTPIKANAVVLRGYNDGELAELVAWAAANDVEMRFLEAMRIGRLTRGHEAVFVPYTEMLESLSALYEVTLHDQNPGATARRATVTRRDSGATSTIGFIASESAPFCSTCRRLRLSATGVLLPCLLGDEGVDLRAWVRDPARARDGFRARVEEALALKPAVRRRETGEFMSRIGG